MSALIVPGKVAILAQILICGGVMGEIHPIQNGYINAFSDRLPPNPCGESWRSGAVYIATSADWFIISPSNDCHVHVFDGKPLPQSIQ